MVLLITTSRSQLTCPKCHFGGLIKGAVCTTKSSFSNVCTRFNVLVLVSLNCLRRIDVCLEAHSIGDIALNSFGKHFVANLKEQALKAESEEEVKEIVNRLYTITDCEP